MLTAMRKRRFSLRSLLGMAVLVALLGYWRDLPRQNANRFALLIAAGDYSAAEAMFDEPHVGLQIGPRPLASGKYCCTVSRRGSGFLGGIR